ncbi:tail fiber protein [Xylella phage Paz]|uniref:Tail fiber protein n=1 Tax=Xylella phage Paz TaxID=1415145 RepID=V5Q8L7_9CAUD|nr:tail fiber protein [Xylella phage Paz]AHB12136.1 tail fiber protein [Xylella phage Paz]
MATITDPTFRFATNVFDTDGTDKVYDISFELGYIDGEYVVAMSGVEDPDTKLLTDMQAHTVAFTDTPPGTRVKVSPVPVSGRKLIIFRQTDISKLLVKFQDGKLQTGRNLDLNSTQLIMAIQEILDGLRNNNLIVEQQIGTVVDMNKLINQIYQQVLQLLASGGIVSVTPRVWSGVWSEASETLGDTDFEIPGADVSGAGFYDTYIEGVGLQPGEDFSIILGDNPTIRFSRGDWPDGTRWFTVLRGYAKPYTGPAPVTTLAYPIIRSGASAYFIDQTSAFSVVLLSSPSAVTATVKLIPPAASNKVATGTFITLVQRGGVVSLSADPGVNLIIPAGTIARTRAANSALSLTCLDADANEWLVSGDLAKQE